MAKEDQNKILEENGSTEVEEVINHKEESENNTEIPKEFAEDSKIVKTTVQNLSKVIDDKLQALHDLATMEVLMPVHARMRTRLKTIKEFGSARSIKIQGHWKTTPPQMHILNLQGNKINNDEAEITFSVYESDKDGNKKLYTHSADVEDRDGNTRKRVMSQEYRIAYDVKEIIKTNKPIERIITKLDRVN